ncbi:unnamed protein product [Kuraishia capsulata CBS 1993]|uniref:Uncharacterized protein n=1 Tax=Kuraishia capsulata CBS 1993 TaxID=1382522 RepID=W6MW91_9ASCO|nr:uncharacterized protein KUCA_T00003012001 [Kuraishia capsulata CBS 1993]CDK27035.1 unnamed protein product [Kuraishia capsulata CBS 1993]
MDSSHSHQRTTQSPQLVPSFAFQPADGMANIPDLRPGSPEVLGDVGELEEEPELDGEVPFLYRNNVPSLYRVQSPTLSVASDGMSTDSEIRQFANPKLTTEFLSQSPTLGSGALSGRMSRHATHISNSLYGSPQHNSSSSSLPGSKRDPRNSFNGQYIPGPVLPPRGPSPVRARSPARMRSPSPNRYRPFNFGSVAMNPDGSKQNLAPGQKATFRRGHRYKHSSVSMNLFQDAPKKAPLNIPKSFPIPTFSEIAASLTKTQKLKLTGSLIHCSLAGLTHYLGFTYSNMCLSTLSHLVFFDSWGNLLLVAVMIMKNFDCWGSSSLVYPFGLGRIEVLVGFALSVSLLFVGGDLFSHLLEEMIIGLIVGDSHDSGVKQEEVSAHSHHVHEGESQIDTLLYESYLLLVCAVTVILPIFVNGYGNGLVEPASLEHGGSKETANEPLANPKISSLKSKLTILYALFCMVYPLFHATPYAELTSQLSTLTLALAISMISWRLIVSRSKILLMAYPYGQKSYRRTISNIRSQITALDFFKKAYSIEDVLISKVNYKIYVIVVNIKAPGSVDDDESKLRFYATSIIKGCVIEAERTETEGKFKTPDTKTSDLLEMDSLNTLDNTGEKFEITIDVTR